MIKRLNVDNWAIWELKEIEENGLDEYSLLFTKYKECPPIFNKEGQYLEGKNHWMEIFSKKQNKILAFSSYQESEVKQFQFDLACFNNKILSEPELKAIRTIQKYNTLPECKSKLNDKLYWHWQLKSLKDIKTDYYYGAQKRMNELKLKIRKQND